MKFTPPVTERETDELIEIANCTNDDWQKEIIEQSKIELYKRGISKKMQEEQLAIWRKEADEIERQYIITLEQNALQSYSLLRMISIFLISPIIILGKVSLGHSYSELKNENYKIMARQRIILLLLGALFYILCLYLFTKQYL